MGIDRQYIVLMGIDRCAYYWEFNIGSGDLLSDGNEPLPEPMLTQICVSIWCH